MNYQNSDINYIKGHNVAKNAGEVAKKTGSICTEVDQYK